MRHYYNHNFGSQCALQKSVVTENPKTYHRVDTVRICTHTENRWKTTDVECCRANCPTMKKA